MPICGERAHDQIQGTDLAYEETCFVKRDASYGVWRSMEKRRPFDDRYGVRAGIRGNYISNPQPSQDFVMGVGQEAFDWPERGSLKGTVAR